MGGEGAGWGSAPEQQGQGERPSFVYLASQSPRRRQLLEQIGVPMRVLIPDDPVAAEALEAARPQELPRHYVRRVTRNKLEAAWAQLTRSGQERAPVICADTTVALGGRILGKPADRDEAARTLRSLSATTHEVFTAVAVRWPGGQAEALSCSRVRMAPLQPGALQRYLDTGEWRGKAGAYAIQGHAARFIAHLDGSYSAVMGLPLYETALLLARAGLR